MIGYAIGFFIASLLMLSWAEAFEMAGSGRQANAKLVAIYIMLIAISCLLLDIAMKIG